MSKQRLIQRLKWYYPTEKFHTFVTFPGMLIWIIATNPITNIVFLIYGMLVCTAILYQGQHYWKLKLWSLQGKIFDQNKNLDFFEKSKNMNFVLIAIMSIFLICQLYLQNWDLQINEMFYWGILANVFAILEHINYYHIQLMIDNSYDVNYVLKNKKLKQSSLAKDLVEQKI